MKLGTNKTYKQKKISIPFSACPLPGRHYGEPWEKMYHPKIEPALRGKKVSLKLESVEQVYSEELPLSFWQGDTFKDITLEEAWTLIKGFYGKKHISGLVLEFEVEVMKDFITTFRAYNPDKHKHYSNHLEKYIPLRVNNNAYTLKGLEDEDLDFLYNLPQNENYRGKENGFPNRFLEKIESK